MKKLIDWLRNIGKPRNPYIDWAEFQSKTIAEATREYQKEVDRRTKEWREYQEWLASKWTN